MNETDLDAFLAAMWEVSPFSAPFNASGQPAISLPLHMTREMLPVGVQLVGKFADDATVLHLAKQLEDAVGWTAVAPIVPPPNQS